MKSAQWVLLFIFISLFIINSCSKKRSEKPEIPILSDSIKIRKIDPYSFSDSLINKKILFVYLDDSTKFFNGVFEDETYGIGFFVIAPLDTINKIKLLTDPMDGIGEGSEIDTLVLNNEKFIYYNSGSAFIGSSNLEVYQYLFSPSSKNIFKSYHTLNEDGSVGVIYSKNLREKRYNQLNTFFKDQIQSKFIDDLEYRIIRIRYE